jgi:hypothetical protein
VPLREQPVSRAAAHRPEAHVSKVCHIRWLKVERRVQLWPDAILEEQTVSIL